MSDGGHRPQGDDGIHVEGEEAFEPHPFLPNAAFETDDPAEALEEAAAEAREGHHRH